MATQPNPRDPRHSMRWVLMSVYLLALIGSIAGGILIAYTTKSAIPLAIPTPLLLAMMKPIIRYVFGDNNSPEDNSSKKAKEDEETHKTYQQKPTDKNGHI